MPLVNVKLIEGVFTPVQKQEMIRKLTDTMVSIEGESMRSVTWVVVEEVKSGDWGIGGNPLTTSDVKSLAASKPKGGLSSQENEISTGLYASKEFTCSQFFLLTRHWQEQELRAIQKRNTCN